MEAQQEEIKHLNHRGKTEERKFKEIIHKTSITSILDMEPYWGYLMENRASLEGMVGGSQKHIERLTQEREYERKRLREMVEDRGEESLLTPQEVEFMNEKLNFKLKELENSEHNLALLENLVTAATNSISLIAFNVMDKSDALDVKPSNSAQFLDYCTETLEDILRTQSDTVLRRPIMRKRTHLSTTESESSAPATTSNFLQVGERSNRGRKLSRRISSL